MDFDHLFPNKDQCLIQKFDIFKEKLKIYLKNRENNLNLNEQNLVTKILTPYILGEFLLYPHNTSNYKIMLSTITL
jgi:hypothetical protein